MAKPRVEVKDENFFFEIIRTNFTKRRKNILNSLSSIIDKENLKLALEKLKIDTNIRGEELTLEQFAKLSNEIKP